MNVKAELVPSMAGDGSSRTPWVTLIGANVHMDFRDALVLNGFGFRATVGALSTPITGGGAGTVIDLDQPEFILSVPAGTAIYPTRIHVQTETPLLATDADESEILVAVDRTAKWAVDGTYTAETIYNRTTSLQSVVTSNCTAASAFTADTTDPVLDIELARSIVKGDVQGTAATAIWTKNELLYEPLNPDLIVGPAMLVVYWGGTVATTGFAQVSWVELQTPYTGLIRS